MSYLDSYARNFRDKGMGLKVNKEPLANQIYRPESSYEPPRKRHMAEGAVNPVKRGKRLRSQDLYKNGSNWNISSEISDMTRHNERRNAIGPNEKWQDALYNATEHMTDEIYGPFRYPKYGRKRK